MRYDVQLVLNITSLGMNQYRLQCYRMDSIGMKTLFDDSRLLQKVAKTLIRYDDICRGNCFGLSQSPCMQLLH